MPLTSAVISVVLSGFVFGFALCNFLHSAFGSVRKPRDAETEERNDKRNHGDEDAEQRDPVC